VTLLNARRVLRSAEAERKRLSLNELLRRADRSWHGVKPGHPDWSHDSHSIALSEEIADEDLVLHIIVNAFWEPLDFELPVLDGRGDPWRRWIDTSLPSPEDIVPWPKSPAVAGHRYRVEARTVAVLFAETSGRPEGAPR
jgi:isoamylase